MRRDSESLKDSWNLSLQNTRLKQWVTSDPAKNIFNLPLRARSTKVQQIMINNKRENISTDVSLFWSFKKKFPNTE